jgi:release factor glutamine methyltransferase
MPSLKVLKNKKDIFYLMNKYSGAVSKVETEMLLEYLFNCAKLDLYVKDFAVNGTIEELYDSLIERRLDGEPVQHITSCAEFMGLDFIVTKDTFIPRPETEILVNEIHSYCRGRSLIAPYVLDLCTGSGNIAVSLAKLMPQAEMTATDISEAALKIAEKNAERHNVNDRIKFYKGNTFNALVFDKNPKFDIIVCNPPYIRKAELPYLQKEVKQEPEIALNGGEDGLDFYRIIASQSHKYLKKRGSILLEMGFGQKQAVEGIFSPYNIFETYKVIKDFSGIERAMWINLL